MGRMLREPAVRKAVLVGCTLQLFQQLSGINTVIYYSARILMMSGISNDLYIVLWISAGVNAVNFLSSFIGLSLVDRLGRRVLTLVSYVGICVSLVILGMGFQLSKVHSPSIDANTTDIYSACSTLSTCYDCTYEYDNDNGDDEAILGRCMPDKIDAVDNLNFVSQYCPTKFAPMIVVGLMTYLVSFQSGLGPIPWIVNSEIYPLWFRSVGVSLSTGFNWALNIMVSYTFLLLVRVMDFGTYYFYAGWSALAIVWFFIVLPETKGKSLEEMEQLFSKPLWRMGRG